MTCTYATWDGSYVLGALSPADREQFERHLAECASCAEAVRDLAGLPGLLSRVDEQAVASPPEPAPDTLLPRLVREVRRERRRRARVATGLAAAAVGVVLAGAATVGVLTGSDAPDPAPPDAAPSAAGSPSAGSSSDIATPGSDARAMQPVAGAPVEGWLTLEEVPWGTKITLLCTYAPTPGGYGGAQPVGYAMVVRTRDGTEREVATWNAVPGRAMQLAAATSSGRADIASVEVRTRDGRPVLRLPGRPRRAAT
jgi:hypothetical protein